MKHQYVRGHLEPVKEERITISVEIDVPKYWIDHPDEKYEEIRKKIYAKWALVAYLTGRKAEDWVRKNDKHSKKEELGLVTFYDATNAVEEAVEAIFRNKR